MYEVVLARSAAKDLEKIDIRYQKAIKNRLIELQENPLMGKKLKDNLSDFRSIRQGVYRIIYQIREDTVLVYVVATSHRQSAY